MSCTIKKNNKDLTAEIRLPTSKSISNRVLMIRALCESDIIIKNLSDSADTLLLQELLKKMALISDFSEPLLLNCRDAGTVARFLTTYLALIKNGHYIITGSERMQQRPMNDLVKSLNSMGASVSYLGNEGFLPLKISPAGNLMQEVSVDCSTSSQFVSSLLLVAPLLPDGLRIKLSEVIASKPYIDMTIRLMEYFGIDVFQRERELIINHQAYISKEISIESDWSGAAFWYEMAAFSENVNLRLTGLNKGSIQGDSILSDVYKYLGVDTQYESDGVLLTKGQRQAEHFQFNLLNNPDIFPSVFITCALLNIHSEFTGICNLKFKESDRIQSVVNELKKFGVKSCHEKCKEIILLEKNKIDLTSRNIAINSYNDHRIAMAFAPVAILNEEIILDDSEVVAKSYPEFWEHLRKVGFEIIEKIN